MTAFYHTSCILNHHMRFAPDSLHTAVLLLHTSLCYTIVRRWRTERDRLNIVDERGVLFGRSDTTTTTESTASDTALALLNGRAGSRRR